MRIRPLFAALCLVLGLLGPSFVDAQTQEPPKKKEEPKPKAKAKKVWSDEDVAGLRKPWDEYADKKQREADEAAAAAQKEKAAQAPGAAPAAQTAPPAVEEAKRDPIEELSEQLDIKQETLTTERGLIEGLTLKLDEEGADRAAIQAEIETKRKLVADTEAQIAEIQKRLADLRTKRAAEESRGQRPAPATVKPPQ